MKFAALLLALIACSATAGENRLRNGSFEGALLYWHNIDTQEHTLVKDAKVGEHALRIAKGYLMSAPFVAERGGDMTVSFWAKGEKTGGKVAVAMPPSAREVGTKAKRLWTREGEQTADIGTEWQRISFTWPADVPADGFWPNPHYLVQFSGRDTPVLVDGVTVTVGSEGTKNYIPRSEIEVVADCTNLPGWEGAKGNAFNKDATAQMVAHVSNPGSQPRELTLRWQFIDYEGVAPVADPIDKKITLAAGKTYTATTPMKLVSDGFVYARLSVHGADGEMIDKSDFPLTSIPYPKQATRPDFRERFGGSFAGGEQMLQKSQRLGFGWTRWYPETKWHNFQPAKGAPFDWHDQKFDLAAAHGVSQHVVLYGWPKGLMSKEHSGQPLPLDMQWGPDDKRWDDLTIETAWDTYVKAAANHFKGKSIVFEIENEPELDKWDKHKVEYAKFTIRTAKQIRAIDPQAKIMVDNVYGIPSGLNSVFFREGGLKYIDVMSWHDYHAGWLTDAKGIRRMKENMAEAGGEHVEIWFNEGWAFTNTAVDEPLACTGLTSAQSTNAHACSVAEMTVAGQEKTILFHTGYETHGQSFWDYSGPGTMLWDWYGFPLPLVGMWNVYNHHIGISDEVGFVRPPGANFTIFQDERNGKGVMIAYADRGAKEDVTVDLPDFGTTLIAEDIMGNTAPAPRQLVLSQTGRPVILYTDKNTPGSTFLSKLELLDRKFASFVSSGGASFQLPPAWEGTEKGSNEGNPAIADGKPIWRIDQVFPPDPSKPENYHPLIWDNGWWKCKTNDLGGQPKSEMKDGAIRMEFRAHAGQPGAERICGLIFIAPQAGHYQLQGTAKLKMWQSGSNPARLTLLRKSAGRVEAIASLDIPRGETKLTDLAADLAAGDELVILPRVGGAHGGGDVTLVDFSIDRGKAGTKNPVYRLPLAWDGERGNPLSAGGKNVWRLDQIWPDKPAFVANYIPMSWNGTHWFPKDNHAGGQPAVTVDSGDINFAVRGSWTGQEGQRIAGLAFIAPESGTYRITGKATSKPWTGGANEYALTFLKKDTQRATEQSAIKLPRSGEPVAIDIKVDLSAGHELVILPQMPTWNNATNTKITGLAIEKIDS